jgi:hypothetical protein
MLIFNLLKIVEIKVMKKVTGKKHATTYSGRTKYSAYASKLSKLSREYLCPQKTQKAAVFFIRKIFGWRVN